MKKLCMMIFSICAIKAMASCPDCNPHFFNKIYLQPEQITMQDCKILVQLQDAFIVVPAVYTDQNGFYIQEAKQPRGRCEPYEWKCDRCGTCNPAEESRCKKCDKTW